MKKRSFIISAASFAVGIVLLIAEYRFGGERTASLMALTVALISIIPFAAAFDSRQSISARISVTAVMTALTVMGRIVFAPLPSFKPVTAMVVITGISLGAEAGFLTGCLSALISNFYFGQGAWTAFQMIIWGLTGFIAGLLSKSLKRSRILLVIYGAFSGIVFSMFMDIWSVLWYGDGFSLSRYAAYALSSAGFAVIYAVSNVIFLLLLTKPIAGKLDRIKKKYGII